MFTRTFLYVAYSEGCTCRGYRTASSTGKALARLPGSSRERLGIELLQRWRDRHVEVVHAVVSLVAQPHPSSVTEFSLAVEIDGAAFPHRMRQFTLTLWLAPRPVLVTGGGSVWRCPRACRRLCGNWVGARGAPHGRPVCGLQQPGRGAGVRRYDDLCRHYGMRASRCNRASAQDRLHRVSATTR